MECSGEEEERAVAINMESSSKTPLHSLKWGHRRRFLCVLLPEETTTLCRGKTVGGGDRKEGIEEVVKAAAVQVKPWNLKRKEKRKKFAVGLKKEEIEDDFMKMVGDLPPRRPKKRPRNVQRNLDMIFPGLWLTEVTTDMYKVLHSSKR